MRIISLKELSNKFDLLTKQFKKQTKLFTNIEELDKTIKGFRAGHLVTLSARPSVGKTTIMCNFMLEMANYLKEDEYILCLTLEQPEYEILTKLVIIEMAKNNLSQEEALKKLSNKNILIFDNFERSIITSDFISKIIEDLSLDNKKVKSVLIDYLHYLNTDSKYLNEQEKINNIMRELKQLTTSEKISIFLLAQLKRTYDNKKDETPNFSDIKGSGAIEQDSDIVLFLYNKDKNSDENLQKMILEVAKNRHGKTKKINILFNTEKQLFYQK